MMNYGFGMNWMWMGVIWIVLIGLGVWAVIALVTRASRDYASGSGVGRNPHLTPADEILRQRFARGEITAEQYESMRQTLSR